MTQFKRNADIWEQKFSPEGWLVTQEITKSETTKPKDISSFKNQSVAARLLYRLQLSNPPSIPASLWCAVFVC